MNENTPMLANTTPSPVLLGVSRAVVALVCIWNLTAALPFAIRPSAYLHSFEVAGGGIGAEALVRGLGIAFLMWQVPFLPVIWQPNRYRACFLCLLGMQFVGLLGESIMMLTLPAGHAALRATGWRFIIFDGTGLILMSFAYWNLSRSKR